MARTKDIGLYESGNGGEIVIIANDIMLTEQLYQQVYLCLFGGNVEEVTQPTYPNDAIRADWWGNSLLFLNQPAKQFNSLTEKALQENTLDSRGRINIQRAVEADLQYFKAVSNIAVNVVILSVYKVQITVNLTQPQNQQDKILQFTWDSAKQELIIEKTI